MGMFDKLKCEFPLPDSFSPEGVWFQTKDTPEQNLQRYILSPDGTLMAEATQEPLPFHGALTFYATNICGWSHRGVVTSDGNAPFWAEYCALYDHGTLLKLEGGCRPDATRPWITPEEFRRPLP